MMVAGDTEGSGDRSEEEKEMDQKGCEYFEQQEDGDIAMAASAVEAQSPPGEEEARGPRKWKWSVIFLCFYGFMVSIKPGEPFITPYLLSPEKNFTREQVLYRVGRMQQFLKFQLILWPGHGAAA